MAGKALATGRRAIESDEGLKQGDELLWQRPPRKWRNPLEQQAFRVPALAGGFLSRVEGRCAPVMGLPVVRVLQTLI
jgi:hypothetical protein